MRSAPTLASYQEQIFKEFMPSSSLRMVDFSSLERWLQDAFIQKHAWHLDPNKNASVEFERVFEILHRGDRTYGVEQIKHMPLEKASSNFIYLFDVADSCTGEGEVRLDSSDAARPYVEGTYTYFVFTQQGLGSRRLRLMNALTQAFYQLPLHSGTQTLPNAERLWKKLCAKNEAFAYDWNDRSRYAFHD